MPFATFGEGAIDAQNTPNPQGILPMKTQLLIALTCSSLALADHGNDFSNGASSVLKGNDFSTAGFAIGNPADTAKGNDFSNGKSRPNKGNDFSNGPSDSGGYSFQSLLEWLSEYGQSSHTGSHRLKADKNRDAKVDFRDLLMILSGS